MNDVQEVRNGDAPRGWKAVYTIVDRAGTDKKFWVRIGTAFVNRDQSLNVKLDGLPTNGQLHIRDAESASLPRRNSDSAGSFGTDP